MFPSQNAQKNDWAIENDCGIETDCGIENVSWIENVSLIENDSWIENDCGLRTILIIYVSLLSMKIGNFWGQLFGPFFHSRISNK